MRKSSRRKILRKETLDRAAKYFLTNGQEVKNKNIDTMLEEQPAFIEFLQYLDKGHENELNKEIIVQLMAIIYTGIRFEKIKLKKIRFSKVLKSLDENAKMKSYFHDNGFDFDSGNFSRFYEDYEQKNILNYVYFAINNQFQEHVKNERDAIFIFYSIKTIADVISQQIK